MSHIPDLRLAEIQLYPSEDKPSLMIVTVVSATMLIYLSDSPLLSSGLRRLNGIVRTSLAISSTIRDFLELEMSDIVICMVLRTFHVIYVFQHDPVIVSESTTCAIPSQSKDLVPETGSIRTGDISPKSTYWLKEASKVGGGLDNGYSSS